METRTQQLTPLLAWPLVASGRSMGPSMAPRGLWLCLGEVLLADSTSMGAARSWAGASASPSTSGECLAVVRPQCVADWQQYRAGPRYSTRSMLGGHLRTSGQWTAGQHAGLQQAGCCSCMAVRLSGRAWACSACVTEAQSPSQWPHVAPGAQGCLPIPGGRSLGLTRLADCLSCAHQL